MKRLLSSFLAVLLCLSPALTKNTEAIKFDGEDYVLKDLKFDKITSLWKKIFYNDLTEEDRKFVIELDSCCKKSTYNSDCCIKYWGVKALFDERLHNLIMEENEREEQKTVPELTIPEGESCQVDLEARKSEKNQNFATPTPQPQVEL